MNPVVLAISIIFSLFFWVFTFYGIYSFFYW
jgi:hypothetical protein